MWGKCRTTTETSYNKKSDGDDKEDKSKEDEILLRRACLAFSLSGFVMMISSLFFQVYSSSIVSSIIISASTWITYVVVSEPAYLFFPWHCLLGESLFILTIGQLAPLFLSQQRDGTKIYSSSSSSS